MAIAVALVALWIAGLISDRLASEGRVEAALAQERAILKEVIARAPAAIALLWGPDHRIRLPAMRHV